TMPVMLFFTAVAALWDRGELGVFSAALLGGLAAFLLYNFHPAKVFMGDTGSLFLGGAVCGLAFGLDIPLGLILVGVIDIAQATSDTMEVGYCKASDGERIFRMAAVQRHLEMGGWSKVTVVCVFIMITLAACLQAFFGVLDR